MTDQNSCFALIQRVAKACTMADAVKAGDASSSAAFHQSRLWKYIGQSSRLFSHLQITTSTSTSTSRKMISLGRCAAKASRLPHRRYCKDNCAIRIICMKQLMTGRPIRSEGLHAGYAGTACNGSGASRGRVELFCTREPHARCDLCAARLCAS
jgi:hypothetical protein